MPTLIDQAIAIAQEHNVAVFPCGDDKRPILKGWQAKASADPDDIREMFSRPGAALVGVPAGPVNDLIVFDLDYHKVAEDSDAFADLQAFEDEIWEEYEPGVRIHETRSGGVHLIMRYPTVDRIPRRILPNMETIYDGFYFIWPTEGSGYTVEVDVPIDELGRPTAETLKVRKTAEGTPTGAALMSSEEALAVMQSNGTMGARHDALLTLTADFVKAAPVDYPPALLCQAFEDWFRAEFPDMDGERLEELLEWRLNDLGDLEGELGRAMKQPIQYRDEALGVERLRAMAPPSIFSDAVKGQILGVEDDLPQNIPVAPVFTPPELKLLVDGRDLAPRRWVLSQKLERGRMSMLFGPPGSGKSTLAMLWSSVAASGVSLIHETAPAGPVKVVYWNGEDGVTELRRRFAGIKKDYPSMKPGMQDNIYLLPTDVVPIKLVDIPPAAKGRQPQPYTPAVDWLREALAELQADVLVIDPLVSSHRLREMDGSEMEILFDVLRGLARELDMAVLVIHHVTTKEGSPGPVLGAVRHATRLVHMTKELAEKQRIPLNDRYQYVQAINAKSNNAAHSKDRWLKLESVEIGNGDTVPVAHSWDTAKNPAARDDVAIAIAAMRAEIEREPNEANRQMRASVQTNNWLGNILGQAFGLSWQKGIKAEDRSDEENAAVARMKHLISIMVEERVIEEVRVPDEDHDMRPMFRLTNDRQLLDFWSVKEPVEKVQETTPPPTSPTSQSGGKRLSGGRPSGSKSKKKRQLNPPPL